LAKGDLTEDAEDSLREPVDLSDVVSALEDLDVFFEKIPMIAVVVDGEMPANKCYWVPGLLAQSNCREG